VGAEIGNAIPSDLAKAIDMTVERALMLIAAQGSTESLKLRCIKRLGRTGEAGSSDSGTRRGHGAG
jgi:hypothetical protein